MDINQQSLKMHEKWQGKIEVVSRAAINNKEDLSLAYTPGVAEACKEIHKDKNLSYKYTRRHNMVAVISDGTAVLGLGDIGPLASMPVMEGKCALFKEFADVDAFPIIIDTKDEDEIINTIKNIALSFGGINLEDIAAPRCFEIERRLNEILDIPVFHDDQHGTAIVVGAGIINSLRLVNKKIHEVKIVINGAGAAGSAITKFLLTLGAKNIILCDINGILHRKDEKMNLAQKDLLNSTNYINPTNIQGSLTEAFIDADIFIGVSKPNLVTQHMIKSMKQKSIVFALANPIPEIMPDLAKEYGAYIVGTGRSDFSNQINNVLAFPGIFKGALQKRCKITDEIKKAACFAIADLIKDDITTDYIIPNPFDKRVPQAIAQAVLNI